MSPHEIAVLINEAGTKISAMNFFLGQATERNMNGGTRLEVQKNISAADSLNSRAGEDLEKAAQAFYAMAATGTTPSPPTPAPPVNTDPPPVFVDPSGWTPENWAWFMVQSGVIQSRVDQIKWRRTIQDYGPGGPQYEPGRPQVRPNNI